ncbi:MAG TPA: hypothetical protein VMH33_09360 [Solirubrobacterales bacterium]|nr:hypothetical protein [Solirubrobacterales bacterium]
MSIRSGDTWLGILLASVCLSLAAAGCGGGSSSTSSSRGTKAASAAFILPGHSNKLPRFGEEAPAEEREEVNAIVVATLRARASADFTAQCETLSAKGISGISGVKKPQECAKALEELAEPLSGTKTIRRDTLKGSIGALRVEGDKAWALYHGTDGKDYAIPLEKEGGSWKIGSIVTTEL